MMGEGASLPHFLRRKYEMLTFARDILGALSCIVSLGLATYVLVDNLDDAAILLRSCCWDVLVALME